MTMIGTIRYALTCAAALFAGSAFAGTQVLGFEIGTSSVEQVRADLSKKTAVKDAGINKYSRGEMLETNGSSYGVSGLNDVLYIFDNQKKLMAVIMNMEKEQFDQIYRYISAKYTVIAEQRPFVGNQYARFDSPDTAIEIDAPRMSFAMEVRYIRKDLLQQFQAQSAAERAAKKKAEAAKF